MTTRLGVMTYNIHNGIGADGRYDLRRIAATIEAAEPDLVALQEIGRHWDAVGGWEDALGDLADALGMQGILAPIYDLDPPEGRWQRRQFGCAVLSRLPVLAWHNHELTRINTFERQRGPYKMPGFLETVVDAGGGRLHFCCTHLSWLSAAVRLTQVEEMLAILRERPAPVVLAGDFNAEPAHPEVRRTAQVFIDAWEDAGEGEGHTFPVPGAHKRIDYIFVTPGIRVDRIRVAESEASDHLPVVAALELPR